MPRGLPSPGRSETGRSGSLGAGHGDVPGLPGGGTTVRRLSYLGPTEARSVPAADPAGYARAYDEAKRALDEQERVVAELRSRVGTLIAAATITTSFLGGRILSSHRLHPLAWAAIGCFAFVGITLLALLWPWRGWRFTVNAQSFSQTDLEPTSLEQVWSD
jgi:hypothetical protein